MLTDYASICFPSQDTVLQIHTYLKSVFLNIYNGVRKLVHLTSSHIAIFYTHTVILQYIHIEINYLIETYKGKEVHIGYDS